MCTSKSKLVAGLRFFELLCADDRFCAELGRTVLAAGRLESALKRHLAANAPTEDTTKATLGKLIQYCKNNSLITQGLDVLEPRGR